MTGQYLCTHRVEIKKKTRYKAFSQSYGNLFVITPRVPVFSSHFFGGDTGVLGCDFFRIGRDMSVALNKTANKALTKDDQSV